MIAGKCKISGNIICQRFSFKYLRISVTLTDDCQGPLFWFNDRPSDFVFYSRFIVVCELTICESRKLAERIGQIESSKSNESNLCKIWSKQITKQIESPNWFVQFACMNIANIMNIGSQICQKHRKLWIYIFNIHIICLICHVLLRFISNKSLTKFTNRANHEANWISIMIRPIHRYDYSKYSQIGWISWIRDPNLPNVNVNINPVARYL